MVVIGNYLIGSVVGRGKFGWVSRARHLELGLEVAVKHAPWAIGEQCQGGINHLNCDHVKESSWQAALLNEAAVLSQISHPAIVALLDVVEGPAESIYLCLEDLGNISLTNLVETDGRPGVPENITFSMLHQVACGLLYLHQIGILHRDVKPDNIMIIKTKEALSAKLIDLGLAATWVPGKLLNTSVTRAGTLAYMAPELMTENTMYGSEIDIFSLGATIYFAIFGEPPFREFTRNKIRLTTAVFGLQLHHEEFLDKMLSAAASLLRSMLSSNPEKRSTLLSVCSYTWQNPDFFAPPFTSQR